MRFWGILFLTTLGLIAFDRAYAAPSVTPDSIEHDALVSVLTSELGMDPDTDVPLSNNALMLNILMLDQVNVECAEPDDAVETNWLIRVMSPKAYHYKLWIEIPKRTKELYYRLPGVKVPEPNPLQTLIDSGKHS